MAENQLRQQLVRFAQRMWQRGWVANHDGNLSVKLPRGRLLCTPTGVSKADLSGDDLLILDERGHKQSGRGRPFSELGLHLAYYQARPDVTAVVHAHPPTATGLALAGQALDQPLLPEAVVTLGPCVPTVPLAMPGKEATQMMAPFVEEHDVLLLQANGAISCGDSVEQAYLRIELLEHLSLIALAAKQWGGAASLPPSYLPPLLEARRKAGLGPEARNGAETRVPDQALLKRAVSEQLQRVLKR